MQQILETCLDYNLWANRIIASYLENAGEEKLDIVLDSSFPSLRKTWYHIWDAQVVWTLRLEGKPVSGWPSRDFSGTFAQAINDFIVSSVRLCRFGLTLSSDNDIRYKNLAGEECSSKVWQILVHVVNHGTYHRGQLVTLLRQTGFHNLRSIDFITYCRNL